MFGSSSRDFLALCFDNNLVSSPRDSWPAGDNPGCGRALEPFVTPEVAMKSGFRQEVDFGLKFGPVPGFA
jgi:hypothetical protein